MKYCVHGMWIRSPFQLSRSVWVGKRSLTSNDLHDLVDRALFDTAVAHMFAGRRRHDTALAQRVIAVGQYMI